MVNDVRCVECTSKTPRVLKGGTTIIRQLVKKTCAYTWVHKFKRIFDFICGDMYKDVIESKR